MTSVDSKPNPFESPAEVSSRGQQSSETGKLIFKTIKYAGGAFLLIVALQLFNIVGITYYDRVDNEPLQNPLRVVRNNNDELELADGRVIKNYWYHERLDEVMKRTGKCDVEIGPSDLGPEMVEVYARDHHFICGCCGPVITIPLIPVHVNRYERKLVGHGDQPRLKTVASR